MLDKKDAQWWILEAQQHPESAADLIRMLADRLAFLDRQNEELRGELIAMRRRRNVSGEATLSAAPDEVLHKRIRDLETALRQVGVEKRLILYGQDRVEANLPLGEAPEGTLVLAERPNLLICGPAASLYIVTSESRLFSLGLGDLPTPEPSRGPAMLGNPRDVAAILDARAFESCRFLVLTSAQGYAYSVLAARVTTAAGRGDKLLRSLIPGDPVAFAVPSYNADLLAVSRQGRWTRFPERALAGSGSLVMDLPRGDTLAALVSLNGEADVVVVSEEGRIFIRPAADYPARKAPGVSAGQPFKGHTLLTVGVGENVLMLTRRGALLVAAAGRLAQARTETGMLMPGLAAGDAALSAATF
jgi:DNA gyrase/topoisomerase IV subunit A